MRLTGILVTLALLLGGVCEADTAIIAEFTGFDGAPSRPGDDGQEVAVGSGGPWDGITFSFLNEIGSETSLAIGTLFLLDQEYLGKPSDLSSATSGYVATGTANFITISGATLDFRLSGDPVGGSSTPEPSSFLLFGMAVTGLGVARWRKRKQTA